MKQTVSDQIRELQSNRGLTQQQLGDVLGLKVRQVQRKLASGNWRVDELERLSARYDVSFHVGVSNYDAPSKDVLLEEEASSYKASKNHNKIRVQIEIIPESKLEDVPAFVKRLQEDFAEFEREERGES